MKLATIIAPIENHRSAWEASLRQALSTSQPALRQQALERAFRHLVHPRLVLETPLLGNDHPWRREALAVSDAFEAVTNGMDEREVWEALEGIAHDSPFEPWRQAIIALRFFYERLDEGVMVHIESIPSHSPLAPLAAALRSLTGHRLDRVSPRVAELISRVGSPDPELSRLVQDLGEGLETDNETLFFQALGDWISTAASHSHEVVHSALIWAWKQLEWRDFDESILLDLGFTLGSEAESYRLAALGTLSWDAEGAALLWLRFILTATREDTFSEAALEEALNLLERFRRAAEQDGPLDDAWMTTWSQLSNAWNQEAHLRGWAQRIEAPANGNAALPLLDAHGTSRGEQLNLFS